MSTTPTIHRMIVTAPIPETKAELHELLRDGQPLPALAEEIATRFMRAEVCQSGCSREAMRVYVEVLAECGYQVDNDDLEVSL